MADTKKNYSAGNSDDDIRLLSKEVQEIISQKPTWVVRNGILIFVVILLLLFGSTFLIRFPLIVNARAKITYANADENFQKGYYAILNLSQSYLGKIKTGQDVILKFDAYPFEKFGVVTCKLNSVSTIITDSGFTAKIFLPGIVFTNSNKKLGLREGLAAQAEITIEKQKLSDKLFNIKH